MKSSKHPRLRFNAAAVFSRQTYQNGKQRRGRTCYEQDGPGALYKYISAGGIQNTANDYERERPRFSSPVPVYFVAAILALIWLVF